MDGRYWPDRDFASDNCCQIKSELVQVKRSPGTIAHGQSFGNGYLWRLPEWLSDEQIVFV
jgi:hypothetical protein